MNRTWQSRRHHYEVERELAGRLRRASREERRRILPLIYQELFSRVPDHPRLLRRDTEEESRRSVRSQLRLLEGQLGGVETFLEIAPGDCRLAYEVARRVGRVYAADISDQRGSTEPAPSNFELLLFDGVDLPMPEASVDLAFSYQFLEHLHPEDIRPHFELVHRALKPGGAYVFATPHRYSGPHDASAGFSDVPEGFHFQEWTYAGMAGMLRERGLGRWRTYRLGRLCDSVWVNRLTLAVEAAVGWLPHPARRRLVGRLFQGVLIKAWKPAA